MEGLSAISLYQGGGGGTVDATDLKSVGGNSPCGFESRPPYNAHHGIILGFVAYRSLLGSPVSGEPFLLLREVLGTLKRRLTTKYYGF